MLSVLQAVYPEYRLVVKDRCALGTEAELVRLGLAVEYEYEVGVGYCILYSYGATFCEDVEDIYRNASERELEGSASISWVMCSIMPCIVVRESLIRLDMAGSAGVALRP